MFTHSSLRSLPFGLALVALLAAPARAEPRVAVPDALRPWVDWVLHDRPEHVCPQGAGGFLCEWPGQVRLSLTAQGGHFEQYVFLDREMQLQLPGGAGRWPLQVRVDGVQAPVLDQDGPVVELRPGAHRIEGRFEWTALPERLELPARVAQVLLSLDGQSVPLPRRDEQGQLWLGKGGREAGEGDSLNLDVTRKLEDGVPLIVTTRIELRVAGRAREVHLGRVLLEGTAPLAIESELPARLDREGDLQLQLRAGSHRVTIRARVLGSPEQLTYRAQVEAWPASEVWVWQADEALRQVELSGLSGVDPARTELAPDWRGLPAFLWERGGSLQLKTLRRGEPEPPPNRIALERELWLDLDGDGYTVRDTLGVEMQRDFRLDLLAGELGHVAVDGEDVLITRAADGRHTGVELRGARQRVQAEWRGAGGLGSLPAVGWSQDVQSLSTTLHLGPGFSVLGVEGADGISHSWIQDWTLFDLFLVLLVAIALLRLVGRGAALLAFAALVVCHGQAGAPGVVFFAVLLCVALLRVLPSGWFRQLVRAGYWISVACLLAISLPFLVQEVRGALYPQLAQDGVPSPSYRQDESHFSRAEEQQAKEPEWLDGGDAAQMASVPAQAPASPVPERKAKAPGFRYAKKGDADADAGGQAGPQASWSAQQDPEATVQTGPGVPTWQWRSWQLRWSGPVARTQTLRVYLLPPPASRALGFLRVLLLGALIALLLRKGSKGVGPERRAPSSGGDSPAAPSATAAAGTALLWLVTGAALLLPGRVRADIPGPELLDQLRTRLTMPPECQPECALIEELVIDVGPTGLRLSLRVHAGALTSVRLPGPASSWTPGEIVLDGRAQAPSLRHEDGYVHVRVAPGSHELEARGPLPAADTLTLAFADTPQRARVRASGYKVDGVREDGRVEPTVQLSRVVTTRGAGSLRSEELPPFLLFEREITLGVRWEVKSRLSRVTPGGTPIRVRVPLLEGESVTQSGLEVAGGGLQVSFGRDEQQVEWTSSLQVREALELVAAGDAPWSERWRVACGPIWHCESSGLTPKQYLRDGRFEPEWWPLAGERTLVRVRRPAAAPGGAVTVDDARLSVEPGSRLLKATLKLRVRSSRRTSEHIALPKGAQVQALSVDGQSRPIRVEGGRLQYALEPGTHEVEAQWRQEGGMGLVAHTPAVALGRPTPNARIELQLPPERWLLFASGPAFGPAVLFWGYLLLVLGAGLLLGRVPNAPLRSRGFVLLGLGLTQIPPLMALLIVAWFFAVALRGRMPEQSWVRHDAIQVVLLFFTCCALGGLYAAIHAGLLVQPDMQVAGAGSGGSHLQWIVDRVQDQWPLASVLSLPLWVFRVLMLLWSLWIAVKLVGWSSWAFRAYAHGGLWKKRVKPSGGS